MKCQKPRPQSQRRRSQRIMFGLQSTVNGSKHPGKRLQVVLIRPPKKRGRKSKRTKWLEKLPIHLGKTKFIYHKMTVK